MTRLRAFRPLTILLAVAATRLGHGGVTSLRRSSGRMRAGSTSAEVQDQVLEDLGDAHNYRRWFVELAQPWLGPRPLEIGAGRGDHAEDLRAAGCTVTVAETDEDRLASLRQRFQDPDVSVIQLTLPERPVGAYSGVLAINVLEHVADDGAALRAMGEALEPGGHVVVFVPAFPSAMSDFDRSIGHHRRYRKQPLGRLATEAGLHVADLRYLNPIGLVAWYVLVRGLGRTPSRGPLLTVFDRVVVPASRWFDRVFPAPFGQSLLLVAQRPAGPRP